MSDFDLELPPEGIGERIWSWFETRNYWLLLSALPVFLGFAGVVVFCFYQVSWTSARAEATCLEIGRQALAEGDARRAQVAYQSLLRLSRRIEPEYLYKLADAYSRQRRRAETVAILASLAPLNKPGYWPAHLLLAQALLSASEQSPEAMRLAEAHLQRLLAVQPQNPDAHLLLGQLNANRNQWEDARKHLTVVVSSRPEASLTLALAQRGLGDEGAARVWADRAAKHFEAKVRTAPAKTNTTPLRLNWADALILLGDYPGAVEVLVTGLQLTSDPDLRPALARVCYAWSGALAKDATATPTKRLEVIQRGLEVMPENLDLLRELALLSDTPGAAGDLARQRVKELLQGGRHAALLQFCLGSVARQRGDLAAARRYLEAAHKAAPELPEVANDLAAVMAEEANPDLEAALALVDSLLKEQPTNPFARQTRGLILLRKDRPEEAMLNLEYALPQLADQAKAREALAKIYAKLGLADLAAEHRRRATTEGVPGKAAGPR